MKKRNFFYFLLGLILLVHLTFSFNQYLQFSADGDLARIVLPSPTYEKILVDPIGISAIFNNDQYAGTNRFFAHNSMYYYFRTVPKGLNNFFDPLVSLYSSFAIAKLVMHLLLLYLLSIMITGQLGLFSRNNLLAMVLITALFQTIGYYSTMGIIDHSISYGFFYAGGMVLILSVLVPWILRLIHGKDFFHSNIFLLVYLVLLFITCFHGPLNAPVILLFGLLWLFNGLFISKRFSYRREFFVSIVAIVFAFYSIYLGTYNIENVTVEVSLWRRYMVLPLGLFEQVFTKLGVPLLLVSIGINYYLLKKSHLDLTMMKRVLRWVFIFCFLYILLLPLGGYRDYRPLIIRYDTFIPVSLSLFYLFGFTSFKLLDIKGVKSLYSLYLFVVLLIYTNADLKLPELNACERANIISIVQSKEEIVRLEKDCSVFSWQTIEDSRYSEEAVHFLHLMGILENKDKRFYYKRE